MTDPIRVLIVMTHPIQYFAPWFRFVASDVDELHLHVVYVTEPTREQQGTGFGEPFEWDSDLRDGYESTVLRRAESTDSVRSDRFFGLDAPDMDDAVLSHRPDVVLVSGWHSIAQVRAIRACRRNGIPLLYRGDTYVEARRRGVRGAAWRLRTKWLLDRFDAYLSVGVRAREYLKYFGIPDRVVFDSPHAVDNAFFAREAAPFQAPERRAASRREWGLGEDAFVVLFVGKLESKKRPQDVVRALSRVKSGATALFVGVGALTDACRELAERSRVSVVWKGFLNQSELGRAYGVSDCLVLPSGWGESWGLVVNEAMATGLPCVVTDRVGCAPDLVQEGETGAVYSVGDVEALAAALDRLRSRSDEPSAIAERCRERVRRYSFARASEGLVRAAKAVVSR